jgi:hypothetical protein
VEPRDKTCLFSQLPLGNVTIVVFELFEEDIFFFVHHTPPGSGIPSADSGNPGHKMNSPALLRRGIPRSKLQPFLEAVLDDPEQKVGVKNDFSRF